MRVCGLRSLGVECDTLKSEALKRLKGAEEAEQPRKRKVRRRALSLWQRAHMLFLGGQVH
jgi:hypothetical protein